MCGIIGICGKEMQLNTAQNLLQLLVHRGQDASGLAWVDEYGIHRDSKVKSEPKFINIDRADISTAIIGSTRYPTYGDRTGGSATNKFAQPFSFQTRLGSLSLAHNGQILNMSQLSDKEYSSDAELITHLLGKLINQGKSLEESIKELMLTMDGAYSCVGIIGDKLFAFRDPRGIRPIVYAQNENFCLVASESVVLQQAGFDSISVLEPGNYILFSGLQSRPVELVTSKEHTHCMFEYIYFASAASKIEDISVYQTRIALGEELALQLKERNIKADYVVPVPDTSKTAAQPISEILQIPLRDAIIKNRSSKRTFIMPTVETRIKAAMEKYLFIDSLIEGKNLLLIDDSIVRGLTLKYLIKLLKQKGANEVHVAITSPPISQACYYGVDFPTRGELIAAEKSESEIKEEINASSLTYLSLDGLKTSLKGLEACYACIDGNYPTPFGEQLKEISERAFLLKVNGSGVS